MGFLLVNRFRNICFVNVRTLSNHSVRVRFAPSPTGFIHLGGLRTAFFNYLYARKNNGKFILRIEDTDRERIVPGSLEHIIDTLKWSKIVPDEGPTFGGEHGPYIQSERREIYKEMIQKLIDNHSAYRCFCTTKRLDLLRREATKNREIIRYDNRCRSLSAEEIQTNILNNVPYTVRLKLKEGPLTVNDLVYSEVTHDLSKIEGDPILFKSDGFPTYHFANVVDDHLMQISHVLRGVEWLISTPKHLMLYEAFGWQAPKFAHLPLIVNKDGTKLSKRHDHIRIDSFRNSGFSPDTINNYLTQMGGGFGSLATADSKEIFSLQVLSDNFTLEKVNQNPSRLDIDKLKTLNRVYIKQKCSQDIDSLTADLITLLNHISIKLDPERATNKVYIRRVIHWCLDRIFTLDDLTTEEYHFLWTMPVFQWNPSFMGSSAEEILKKVIQMIEEIDDEQYSDSELMLEKLKQISADYSSQVKFGPFMRFLRLCLTNLKVGTPIVETMHLLGKDITLEHLTGALHYVKTKSKQDCSVKN